MADVIRQLAVKTSTGAASATSYDIGSDASKVTFSAPSSSVSTWANATTVDKALDYLKTHSGGVTQIELPEFSTIPSPLWSNLEGVTGDSVIIESQLSNPEVQMDDWTVVTGEGTIQVTAGTISGATTMKLILGNNNPVDSPADTVHNLRLNITGIAPASGQTSFTKTVTDSRIQSNHVLAWSKLSNPSAQTGGWEINTYAGSLTISGGTGSIASGSTTDATILLVVANT